MGIARSVLAIVVAATHSVVALAQSREDDPATARTTETTSTEPSAPPKTTAKDQRPADSEAPPQRPGANPVTRRIDFGHIRPGSAPVLNHAIKGRGISLPKCARESREGEPCE